MTLLLYAIASPRAGDRTATHRGLDGKPLRALDHDALTAFISELDAPPRATEAALRTYGETVEQLTEIDVLPARFGSTFESEADVREMLRTRREELTERLEHTRGAVELGVRVEWPTPRSGPAPDGPNAGIAYMLQRLDVHRRARDIADQVQETLGDLARESSRRILPRPSTPVIATYLVDRDQVEEFLVRAHELDHAIEDATLICTGPWPPYSFVRPASADQAAAAPHEVTA